MAPGRRNQNVPLFYFLTYFANLLKGWPLLNFPRHRVTSKKISLFSKFCLQKGTKHAAQRHSLPFSTPKSKSWTTDILLPFTCPLPLPRSTTPWMSICQHYHSTSHYLHRFYHQKLESRKSAVILHSNRTCYQIERRIGRRQNPDWVTSCSNQIVSM